MQFSKEAIYCNEEYRPSSLSYRIAVTELRVMHFINLERSKVSVQCA